MASNTATIIQLLLKRYNDGVSDSSSSSDDESELALCERGNRKLRPRINRYMDVVDRYTDHEFKSHFRMSRTTFQYILGIITKDLSRNIKGCPTIPPRTQLMIALWKMGTMDSYRSVCDRLNVGRATALRTVRRVSRALFSQAKLFIQWTTGERAMRVMQGFSESGGFPRTIGTPMPRKKILPIM